MSRTGWAARGGHGCELSPGGSRGRLDRHLGAVRQGRPV